MLSTERLVLVFPWDFFNAETLKCRTPYWHSYLQFASGSVISFTAYCKRRKVLIFPWDILDAEALKLRTPLMVYIQFVSSSAHQCFGIGKRRHAFSRANPTEVGNRDLLLSKYLSGYRSIWIGLEFFIIHYFSSYPQYTILLLPRYTFLSLCHNVDSI